MGNPGAAYAATRHNVGFQVVDRVASKLSCTFRKRFLRRYLLAGCGERPLDLFLAKPLTFMNRSGEVLDRLFAVTRCGLPDLLVVCDTLDLPVGVCRMKSRGSSAGHNGLASIIEHAGSDDFKRIYVGIGRPPEGGIVEYVLREPPEQEISRLSEAVDTAADGVIALLEQPVDRVMNGFNRR